jgi:hypothetical protein
MVTMRAPNRLITHAIAIIVGAGVGVVIVLALNAWLSRVH